MGVNKKSFNLRKRVTKAFSLLIDDFVFATTIFFRIRERIRLYYLPTFTMKAVTLMRVPRTRLLFSSVKLIANVVQTISSRTIVIVYSMTERLNAVTTINLNTSLGFVSKATQKITSTIYQGNLEIIWGLIVAQFFVLGDFDPDDLGTLDLLTLGDMDYTL